MKKNSERLVHEVKAYLTKAERDDMQKRMDGEMISAVATYLRRLILRDIQDNL